MGQHAACILRVSCACAGHIWWWYSAAYYLITDDSVLGIGRGQTGVAVVIVGIAAARVAGAAPMFHARTIHLVYRRSERRADRSMDRLGDYRGGRRRDGGANRRYHHLIVTGYWWQARWLWIDWIHTARLKLAGRWKWTRNCSSYLWAGRHRSSTHCSVQLLH